MRDAAAGGAVSSCRPVDAVLRHGKAAAACAPLACGGGALAAVTEASRARHIANARSGRVLRSTSLFGHLRMKKESLLAKKSRPPGRR